MKTTVLGKFFSLFFISLYSANLLAMSAVAAIDGAVKSSWYYASNHDTQKAADQAALEGCRVEARKNGLGKLANKCIVASRGKAPGFGALSCGDQGCNWTGGYQDRQQAIDDAYMGCSKLYSNCATSNLTVWEDFAGFKQPHSTQAVAPNSANCIPNTAVRRCTSQCTNGNCLVTYSNGCKVQVRVSPSFNSFNNQWEYPSPNC